MNIIIENGIIVSEKVIHGGSVVIEGNRIVDVGSSEEISRKYSGSGYVKVDARDKIVAPGFINAHTHIAMTLLRGYADDLHLQEWLEKWIWPYEAKMTDRDIELGALLGSVESLLNGVTTVCSMYHYHKEHNEASAALQVGIRMVMGVAMFSWDMEGSIKNAEDALDRWHGREGLVKVSLSPHAPYTVSPELWKEAERIRKGADERLGSKGSVVITTHVLEDWREPELVKNQFKVDIPSDSIYLYLDKLGVLSPRFTAAHSIHMNEVDYEVASRRGVKIVHNPVANLKLGMGIANVPKMHEYRMTVGLGTDGPASNNTLDLIETMKYASLLPKGLHRDPTLLNAKKVFEMATVDGARTLGYDDLGLIKPGYLADIVIIDRRRVNLTPLYDVYSHIVYAMRASDVETVIVNGDLVVEDRVVKGVDVHDLMRRVEHRAFEIRESLETSG